MPAGLPYVGWNPRPTKNGQPPPCTGQCSFNIASRKVGAAMKVMPTLQYGHKAKDQILQQWDPVSKRLITIGDRPDPSYVTTDIVCSLDPDKVSAVAGIHAYRSKDVVVEFWNNGGVDGTTGGQLVNARTVLGPYSQESNTYTFPTAPIYGNEYYYSTITIPRDAVMRKAFYKVSNTAALNLEISARSLVLTPASATVGYASNYLSRRTITTVTDGLGGTFANEAFDEEPAGDHTTTYPGTVYGGETYTSACALFNTTTVTDSASLAFALTTKALQLTATSASASYSITSPCRGISASITNATTPSDAPLADAPQAEQTTLDTDIVLSNADTPVYGGELYAYTVNYSVAGIAHPPIQRFSSLPLGFDDSAALTVSPGSALLSYYNTNLSRTTFRRIENPVDGAVVSTIANDPAGSREMSYATAVYGNEIYTARVLQQHGGDSGTMTGSYAATGVINAFAVDPSGLYATFSIAPGQVRQVVLNAYDTNTWNQPSGGSVVAATSAFLSTSGGTLSYATPALWHYHYVSGSMPSGGTTFYSGSVRYLPTATVSMTANTQTDVFTLTWDIQPNPWPGTPVVTFRFLQLSGVVATYTTSLLSGSDVPMVLASYYNRAYTVELRIADEQSNPVSILTSGAATLSSSVPSFSSVTLSQVTADAHATVDWTSTLPSNVRADIYQSVDPVAAHATAFYTGANTLGVTSNPSPQTLSSIGTVDPAKYYFAKTRAVNYSNSTVATSAASNAVAGSFTRAYTNVLSGGGASSNFSGFALSSSTQASPYVYTLTGAASDTTLPAYFVQSFALTSTQPVWMDTTELTSVMYIVNGTSICYFLVGFDAGTIPGGSFSSVSVPTLLGTPGTPASLAGIASDNFIRSSNSYVYVASTAANKIYRIQNITSSPVITQITATSVISLAISASNTLYWASSTTIFKVASSSTSGTSTTMVSSLSGVSGIALSPDDATLYVWKTSGIVSVNVSTNAATTLSGLTSSVVGATPGPLSVNADGNLYFVTRAAAGTTPANTLIHASPLDGGSVIRRIQFPAGTLASAVANRFWSTNALFVASTAGVSYQNFGVV